MSDTTKGGYRRKKEVTLTGIFGEKALDELLRKLVSAIGTSFFIIDYRGQVVTERMLYDGYCKEGCLKARECQECTLTSAFAAAKAAIKCEPFLFHCPNGLVSMALPVIVNDQYLGAVIGGRTRCPQADSFPVLSDYEQTAKREEDAELYEMIPVMSRERIMAISELVFTLLKEMGDKETSELHMASMERQDVHLRDIRKKNVRLQRELEEAQQENRKAKILPQFLTSLLGTVSNFAILEKAEKTEDVISNLSSIFRYYVNDQSDLVSVEKELEQIGLFLKTWKAQYGERFDYEICCTEMARWKTIPVLSIFPFVDYIINTGLLPAAFKGNLLIETEVIGDRLVISIELRNSNYLQHRSEHKKNTVSMLDEKTIEEQMDNTKNACNTCMGKTTVFWRSRIR
ncbi:MAG: PocR ligand-binding domain-containing protein [Clostridiales bacterium]|nr:PocR ligand-binding domain-containing protein [Clostridiales bacterium]